ncbi:MAG: hypothetical protein JNK82_24690 [Myxococcaceae bacterium]|nr:hypothetical protein [Myxococcaceae bacterium]
MKKTALVIFLFGAACGVGQQPVETEAQSEASQQSLAPAPEAGGNCSGLCAASSCRPWHTLGECFSCILQCCQMMPSQC